MPALYHFNSDQFKENLVLGGGQQHMVVAGRLCQYLKSWQLDGLRFLYRHFEKGDSCILNDESGLGKAVTVAVFLGAMLTNERGKKCLIIVHDDEHIEGWRFHLSVLTQLTVKVIERASDINYETVFLIKWSTLKNIGEIAKVTFDHIIIDNRGEMLTNKFCTGILLRYYENKTSIVISSADVTADIKLLHILLRLCGRLDRQYTDVKTFEDKFQLPKLKDGVASKVDLEDYFLKREKVINFCREFRLRRYCHQFEEEFPLVPSNEFKRHLEQWRCSIENSQSSGSVKLLSSSSEKDIEELFQAYFQVKEERHASKKLDCEVQQITQQIPVTNDDENLDISDEVVVMSPLFFVSESESDGEDIQLQIEIKNIPPFDDEVKDEEEEEDGLDVTSLRREEETAVNRRKSTKPVKISAQDNGELMKKESLRSRKVPNSESPSRERKKLAKLIQKPTENDAKKRGRPANKNKQTEKVTQKSTDNDVNTPNKNGRKPMVKVMKDSETNKRLKDEENEKRGTEAKAKNLKEKIEEKRNRKNEDKEKSKLEKSVEDNRRSKDNAKDSKRTKETEEKRPSKSDESKKSEVIAKNTPSKLEGSKLSNIDEKNEKKTLQDRKRRAEDEKEKQSPKDAKKESKKDELVITKKTPTKVDETQKRTSLEDSKPKETTKQDRKKTNNGEEKGLGEKKRSKSAEDRNKTAEGEDKQKKKQSKPQEKVQANARDKSKEAKEEENKKKRGRYSDASKSKVKKVRENRLPSFKLMLSEANKFINNKHIGRNTVNASEGNAKRTRTPSVTSPKSPKSVEKSVASPKSSSKSKDKRNTKPLTVYTPLGVHSRSTRGMERCTRSCPIQNKYMKIAIAQVDIDKAMVGKTKRRSVATPTTKLKSPPVEVKLPPSIPPISESPAPLESMQLGQILSPTNGSLVADYVPPPPKNVDYNFPLMLDKDIHDTECIITSQTSNNNEIIVLTGSSSTDIEMEPPKSIISRRKATLKPPMVTIPRPSYNKAKSPDLFSTCSNELSLPCSQNNKSQFEGFKIFGSELRQSAKHRSCLDILERIPDPRSNIVGAGKKLSPQKEKPATERQEPQHCIEDEDAMFEITSNGTFGNIVRVNSKGEISPVRNKNQSTPPSVSHPKNRITNYLISNNANGAAPSSSLEDASADPLPKTPKRRKSLSGTVKRSPRALTSLIAGGKSQSTKLTQWLVKNAVVRISDTTQKPLASKRRRLDLLFPDD